MASPPYRRSLIIERPHLISGLAPIIFCFTVLCISNFLSPAITSVILHGVRFQNLAILWYAECLFRLLQAEPSWSAWLWHYYKELNVVAGGSWQELIDQKPRCWIRAERLDRKFERD